MDSKDFRLLVALHENARLSYRQLGRRVSLSAPAVRDRLKRLWNRGILQGYWLYVDPNILDREDLMIFYRGNWKREDAMKALGVDDVAFVAWKLDGGLSIQTWPRELSKPIKQLTMRLGTRPSGRTYTKPRKSNDQFSLIDWRIIDSLVDDPTIPLEKLVQATGLSPKTVRKHLQQLIREETIFIMPKLGSLADPGEIVYNLTVTGKVSMNELRKALGEIHLIGETHEPPTKYLLCRANNLAEVTTATQMAKKLSGAESVEVSLNRELFIATDLVHRLVRDKMRDWRGQHSETSPVEPLADLAV